MTITHTISRTFVAGGIVEYPSEAEPIYGEHEGTTLAAGDGTPTNVWVGNKRRWRYSWKSPRPEIVARWTARYVARSTFVAGTPEGGSFTAVIPVGKLEARYIYEPTSGNANGTTYTLTVEVWEV